MKDLVGKVVYGWKVESKVGERYSVHCVDCSEERSISERGLESAMTRNQASNQVSLFPSHICSKKGVNTCNSDNTTKVVNELEADYLLFNDEEPTVELQVEEKSVKKIDVSGLVTFLSALKGMSFSKFTLLDIETTDSTVTFIWKCDSCGALHRLNETESVLLKTGMYTCKTCLIRGILSAEDVFIGLTLGTYKITGINTSDLAISTECIHCKTIHTFSFNEVDSMIKYNSVFKHYEDFYCKACGFSTSIKESEPFPRLRKGKMDASIEINGDILKYKYRQVVKSNSNIEDCILLDTKDIGLTSLALSNRTNDSVAINYIGSDSSLQLNRFMLDADVNDCVLYKNGLMYDLRRGNLLKGKKALTKYYKFSQGVFNFEKESLFKGKLLNEQVEGKAESDVLLDFRELECRVLGSFAYNPVYDFSGVSNAINLIFDGVLEEDLVILRLNMLAQNPWLCFRYNLFSLLDKYNIELADYVVNDQGFICNTVGVPYVYLV